MYHFLTRKDKKDIYITSQLLIIRQHIIKMSYLDLGSFIELEKSQQLFDFKDG
jgi:hypothetical protein